MKAISKKNCMNLQLWGFFFLNAVNRGRTYQKPFSTVTKEKKKPLTLLIFCRLVVGSAARVL